MWSPKSIILVISSTLPLSVKKKVPTRSDSLAAPAVPPVLLPGFDQSTESAKRPRSRQSVCAFARQEAEAPAAAGLKRARAAVGGPRGPRGASGALGTLIHRPEEPGKPS